MQEASKIQQKLTQPLIPKTGSQDEPNEDEYIARLIEDGMPEKRKEKKMKDIV